MPTNFHKPINSLVSVKSETSTFQTVNGTGLTFTLCDRTVLSDRFSNYFSSFNLPHLSTSLLSTSSLIQSFPELYQLNLDQIVICPIPASYYNDMIDGRSLTLTVPQENDGSTLSAKTVVSSTYHILEKRQENILLGKNIAFLFSDDINKPYTGTTTSGTNSYSSNTTWNTSNYQLRPAAVSYQDLQSEDINTDTRAFSSITQAVSVSQSFPNNTNQGYNYDIPVGFVALDKGFIVLTHPEIVNNIPWGSGFTSSGVFNNVAPIEEDIYFTSTTTSQLTFHEINVKYRTSAVCMALPGEFYFTNNPTWDFSENLSEYTSGNNNFDPTFITEIGLYNNNNELIALAKLDRPKEKGYTGVFTFTLDIDI